jgi:hypothetical protein
MASITCAISGIRFQTSYMDGVSLPHTIGYFHPIFAVPQRTLYKLYGLHVNGELTPNDSYLLFLAFLHSSGKIDWTHPATIDASNISTKKLVQNNIAQLVTILEKSALIKHPSFKQPSFKVVFGNSSLEQIPNWIKAWEKNIEFFNTTRAAIRLRSSLMEVENKLSELIERGEKPEKYAYVIAAWASEAAGFPPTSDDLWKSTIRSCFNITKMFNTPLPLLKEIKDYCECNIQAGSMHFHALSEVLKAGISRHHDYLGGSALATGYQLLPAYGTGSSLEEQRKEQSNKAEIMLLAANAPNEAPIESNYPDSVAFLRAKLAFRIAKNIAKKEMYAKNFEPLPDAVSNTPILKQNGEDDL